MIESRSNNRIAVSLEAALLSRVLRAASANDAGSVEMRLAVRGGGEGPEGRGVPVLSFRWSGFDASMVQDLPTSRPLSADSLAEIVAVTAQAAPCPFYVDVAPELGCLHALLDKIRAVSGAAALTLTRSGALHVGARGTQVRVGCRAANLAVLPAAAARETDCAGGGNPGLAGLVAPPDEAGAVRVELRAKHLAKALGAAVPSRPAQVLLGVGPGEGYVQVHAIYRDPGVDGTHGAYDDSVGLSMKLPTQVRA